jgi:Protein of unknown function (DUF3363)
LSPKSLWQQRWRDFDNAAAKLPAETGLASYPVAKREHLLHLYRPRVSLTGDRFAMIGDGLGFKRVPWRPALDMEFGREVRDVIASGARVDWNVGRKPGLGR